MQRHTPFKSFVKTTAPAWWFIFGIAAIVVFYLFASQKPESYGYNVYYGTKEGTIITSGGLDQAYSSDLTWSGWVELPDGARWHMSFRKDGPHLVGQSITVHFWCKTEAGKDCIVRATKDIQLY